ncbi:MAG: hypothetical protein UU73_C0002G0008 [Candidatus Daviesbacteria bacterium GW2011_GWA1_41_61]|uniref:Glycosyltransferase RgtA/B/C/D-like domain-containing protein n=1 Tax=Candidatus Daviesbacteria bacterium GW2011_GWA2_40_9 TaxID=1618424 RepID=A0A0G0X7W9_9BACT|nr:MAG: hypothetical protein UU26_C0008G0025 [Candidatus Daviesbacteria bacterium GW2011_GWC1_40_9]KKR83737.1 MAG: hypothetical protein UU29_C0002G0050 [Candidatus Daviesbacteria bacterium GW2011_GWA2_40_9]KKR93668.1 MAG: hypothetical protein UU44_C0001G0008 [Candidatus Daviesbacteria bacterium GW2011_GWB1_41_15]KKS15134.1 MAG: hypothetical protein UU73_C0002G0008 [Candidatus Daviesbacteria bacterium GW2011_GWA1_41_61]
MRLLVNPKWINILCLIILMILSLPPRLWQLSAIPPVIVDEPANLRDINKMIDTPNYYPANFQWDFNQATLVHYPAIAVVKIFSSLDQLLALRLTSVALSLLALIPFFLIIQRYTNTYTAFLSTLLFSFSYYYLQFSRVGWTNIHAITLGLYLLWSLLKTLDKQSKRWLIVAGILAGLTLYTYRGAHIYLLASFVLIAAKILSEHKKRLKMVVFYAIFGVVSLIISTPWLITVFNNWQQYNLRLSVISVSATPLPYHGVYSPGSVWQYQISTVFKSWFLMQSISGDNIENKRYLPLGYPAVNHVVKLLFWAGLIMAVLNFPSYWYWLFILGSGLILGQVLTVDPPNGSRALSILPIIYLLSALPLYALYKRIANKPYLVLAMAIMVSLVAFQDYQFYQYWMSWIEV